MSGNVNSLFAVEKEGGEGVHCLKATMTEVSLMPRNKTRISWGRGTGVEAAGLRLREGFLQMKSQREELEGDTNQRLKPT